MFHTNVRAMDGAADGLERQLRKLKQATEAVRDVRSRLNGLSGMDNVRRNLDSELSGMEQEQRNLLSLLAALRMAARCYADCERRIIDYAECGRRQAAVSAWYMVNLSGEVRNLAEQIIF
ncbi:MAG: hypothetical protein NC121_04750 [Blautia sp.]|nr:hypothetical protein [Blautia sp.]